MTSQPPYKNEDLQALLLDYAAGAMDDALSLMITSLLTLNPEARSLVRKYERLGGALVEHCCETESMSLGSLQRVLSKIDQEYEGQNESQVKVKPQQAPIRLDSSCIPQAIHIHIETIKAKNIKWQKFIPGVEVINIPVLSPHHSISLIRMGPNITIPNLSQNGKDIILVLEGSYKDKKDIYGRGDIVINESRPQHKLSTDPKVGCTILAVMDMPIRIRRTYSFFKIFIRS